MSEGEYVDRDVAATIMSEGKRRATAIVEAGERPRRSAGGRRHCGTD